MLFCVFIILAYVVLVLQTTLVPLLPPWAGRPDLPLVLLVHAAIRLPTATGLAVTLLMAIGVDILAGVHTGPAALAYLALFAILRSASGPLALAPHQPMLAGLGTLLVNLAIYLGSAILTPGDTPVWSWRQVLLSALTTGVCALPLTMLFDDCAAWIRRRQRLKRQSAT